ncbi:MAG: CPBP family intramembrane glutamic endopeptidase [Enhygromyxa sp.]
MTSPQTPPQDSTEPPGLAAHGMLSMLFAGLESAEQRQDRPAAAVLMLITWLGFIGISGAHLGKPWPTVLGWIPGPLLFALGVALLLSTTLRLWSRRPALARLALMLGAYLLGNLLSGLAHQWLEPSRGVAALNAVASGFILSRLIYASAVALPMWLVYRLAFGDRSDFHLGLGRWSPHTRLGRHDRPRPWYLILAGFAVFVAVPVFVFMQAQVDFGPWHSGRLLALALPLLLMALANAFAEELLFRGLMQGASIHALGAAWGIWMVGLVFGLHHYQASFETLASLPTALLLGAGSVLFAKSVVETRGLAWSVCAHAMINMGLFSAYYVAS